MLSLNVGNCVYLKSLIIRLANYNITTSLIYKENKIRFFRDNNYSQYKNSLY